MSPRPPGLSCFPRLYAAASLKLHVRQQLSLVAHGFPRLYAAASLKPRLAEQEVRARARFPRLYAAASLKPCETPRTGRKRAPFSAALCRGLIEASRPHRLKAGIGVVFRGFMPRPH